MKDSPKILIIAGSDSGGGAGIQADIKVATAHNTYCSTAITCLTAQNSCGVFAIHNSPIDFLRKQIEVVLDDTKFDAIKIGMLGTSEIINCIHDILNKKAPNTPLILDTVMVATSGDLLLEKEAIKTLKSTLIKNSYIVTPNIDEAEILAEMPIRNLKEMKEAAIKIKNLGANNVLIKGGHLEFLDGVIKNLLVDKKGIFHIVKNKRIGTHKLHGTGCTLASALACNISKGMELGLALKKSNSYVYRSIKKSVRIGKGSSILTHF